MKLMQLSLGATDYPLSQKNALLLFSASQPKKVPFLPGVLQLGKSQFLPTA